MRKLAWFSSCLLVGWLGAQPQIFDQLQQVIIPGASTEDITPTLTEDELYMVFASSGRAGGLGGYDLYETRRPAVDAPWNPPQPLVQLNSIAADYECNLSYDGLELYYVSTRAGGVGPSDLYASRRSSLSAPWQPPQNLGTPVNGPGIANDDPYLTQDGLAMFYTGPGAGGADILLTRRPSIGAPWGPPQPFAAANSTVFDHSPMPEGNLDQNGDVGAMWIASNRTGGGGGSSDWFLVINTGPGTYQTVPIADLNSSLWESNGFRRSVTGRFYFTRGFGAGGRIWCACYIVVHYWIIRCERLLIVVRVHSLNPLHIWVLYRWRISITAGVIVIGPYDWWPNMFVFAHFLSPTMVPGNGLVFPGIHGSLMLDPNILIQLGFSPRPPSGLGQFQIPFPPNPGLIGGSVFLQTLGVDFPLSPLTGSWSDVMQITFTQ